MVDYKKPDTSKNYDKDIKDIWTYIHKLYAALSEDAAARVNDGITGHAGLSNLEYANAGHTGFVPDTRTVNGNPLSANITLTYSDVGAAAATQPAWTEVLDASMTGSWVNFGGSTVNSVGYFKDTLGIVHLKGVIKDGTITSAAFTLPSGYRPAKRNYFATVSNDLFGFALVNADGTVVPQVGNNTYFTLDGITFRSA